MGDEQISISKFTDNIAKFAESMESLSPGLERLTAAVDAPANEPSNDPVEMILQNRVRAPRGERAGGG